MLILLQTLLHPFIACFWVTLSHLTHRPIYIATAMRHQKPMIRHLAAPDGLWFRGITPRFRKRWHRVLKRPFSAVARAIYGLGNRKTLIFVHWGYSDKQRFGFDFRDLGYQVRYLENTLIGFGIKYGFPVIGYLSDSQRPYFDGRGPSDLEDILNATRPGDWRDDPAIADFVETARNSSLQKFLEYDQASPLAITGSDVVVVGQVPGDAAWIETVPTVADNLALVCAAVDLFGPARRIFYKPHPRNPIIVQERRAIAAAFPQVVEIGTDVSLKQLFRARPAVAVNTSGAGLDAGMAGCAVHAFGVSFYAGWGATTDHFAPVTRRANRLTFEDIFATALVRYTRYFERDSLRDAPIERVTGIIRSFDADQAAKR
ncbi:capsular polysaccharide export protein, LipB/KpsS family [Actibacterium sp. D379-3]